MKNSDENNSFTEDESLNQDQLTTKGAQDVHSKVNKNEKDGWFSVIRGFLLALLSELCLATSNVFIKKAELFSVMEQALIRYLIQFVCMFVIIKLFKEKIVQSDKKLTGILLLRGLLGTFSILLTMCSLKLINPSDTIALVNLNVVFVAILARFFLPNEKLNIFHILTFPIITIGKSILKLYFLNC